jgi:hypothetical protein
VNRLVTVVTLAILLAELILFGLSDLTTTVTDTALPTTKQRAVWASL